MPEWWCVGGRTRADRPCASLTTPQACDDAYFVHLHHLAGVGADPKQRHFRTVSQAAKYDRTGAYVRRWLPELAAAGSAEAALRPFAHGVDGWPTPLVDPASQLTWQDAQRLDETGRLL